MTASPASVRDASAKSAAANPPTPLWLSVLLIVLGLAGLIASFALSFERIVLLQSQISGSGGQLSCDINPFVTCSGAMESPQGTLFWDVPNPFIGMMAFVAPIAIGVATLAGARFARWFWVLFMAGVLLGLVFVLWLATQSIFVLGLVCPWCFFVWQVMYWMFWPTLTSLLADGHLPATAGLRNLAIRFRSWSWVLSLVMTVAVVLIIMIQLPEIPRYLFGS